MDDMYHITDIGIQITSYQPATCMFAKNGGSILNKEAKQISG
jgi:hypothetical protein